MAVRSSTRSRDIAQFGFLYQLDDRFNGACTYCGMPADTVDHVLPISALSRLIEAYGGFQHLPYEIRHSVRTVPCCFECNCWLGARNLITVTHRRDYVKAKIKQKYKRFLARVMWDDDELGELGPTLHKYIKVQDEIVRMVAARIMWPRRSDR